MGPHLIETMKKILVFLLIFSSCASEKLEDNQILKEYSDQLAYSECWLVVQMDSLGNTIDTVSISKKKFDDDGDLRFQQSYTWHKNQAYISKRYYWKDGTDYLSTTESASSDFKSHTEVQRSNKGELINLISIAEFDGISDTLQLVYQYRYSLTRKLVELRMENTSDDGDMYIMKYNCDEIIASKVVMNEKDTLEKSTYDAEGNLKSEQINKFGDTLVTISYYSVNNELDSSLTYVASKGMRILAERVDRHRDALTKEERIIETNLKSGSHKEFLRNKIPCQ